MAACDDTTINVDWQFNVNAQDGDLKFESPLSASGVIPHVCPFQPGVGPNCGPHGEALVMDQLMVGQGHNPGAQQSYRDCRAQIGSPWAFWLHVMKASPGRPSNLRNARIDIAWQHGANPDSIVNARNCWRASQQLGSQPESQRYFMALAMHFSQIGQRHNAGAMQNYRACFRDDAGALFTTVLMFRDAPDFRSIADRLEQAAGDGSKY
jgi:hypothetical protein